MIRPWPNRSRKGRILVVEDEAIVAADIQDQLAALGYSVSGPVDSAAAAVDLAGQCTPDLVLMDIALAADGGGDGVRAAEEIRRRYDIPVVFLTAHADEATLERAKATGPFGYMLKPFSERDLRVTVEVALHRHRLEGEARLMELWLNAILDHIGDPVLATDRWGLVNFINPQAARLLGCPEAEALSRPLGEVAQLLDPATRRPSELPLGQGLADENQPRHEPLRLLVGADGAETFVRPVVVPIPAAQGERLGSVIVLRADGHAGGA